MACAQQRYVASPSSPSSDTQTQLCRPLLIARAKAPISQVCNPALVGHSAPHSPLNKHASTACYYPLPTLVWHLICFHSLLQLLVATSAWMVWTQRWKYVMSTIHSSSRSSKHPQRSVTPSIHKFPAHCQPAICTCHLCMDPTLTKVFHPSTHSGPSLLSHPHSDLVQW